MTVRSLTPIQPVAGRKTPPDGRSGPRTRAVSGTTFEVVAVRQRPEDPEIRFRSIGLAAKHDCKHVSNRGAPRFGPPGITSGAIPVGTAASVRDGLWIVLRVSLWGHDLAGSDAAEPLARSGHDHRSRVSPSMHVVSARRALLVRGRQCESGNRLSCCRSKPQRERLWGTFGGPVKTM